MMTAVKGVVHGNTVVVEEENIRQYDGCDVIVTFLNTPKTKSKTLPNFDSFVLPTERGKNVDSYMNEIRANDRM